jgi:hypothetical protein
MKTLSLRTSIFTTLTLLTSSYAVKVEIEADPSHGCQNTIDHATLAEISTKLQNRPIKVTLPPSYDAKKPNPLILVYNDRDVTLENMVEYTGLSDDEVNKEAVVVYVTPQKGVRSSLSYKKLGIIGGVNADEGYL